MAARGRSRNAPCFCGSGRKLKHCCARQLTPVRTWKHASKACRWRFWAPHDRDGRYASEIAEHICSGERIWIARGTADGATWQIDDDPATLFTVLDQLPAAHYHWAIEQTMAVLDGAAPDDDADEDPDRELPREIRHLTFETLALAHASDALGARLNTTREDPPHGLTLHDHAIMRVA